MRRLIDADELMKKLGFIRELERQIYGRESFGFALKCIREVQDALTIAEHSVCEERYQDLLEYFDGNDTILKDRKEFKAWLERIHWHVLECNKLARELEKKQERKTGKWMIISNANNKVTTYKCSECGRIVYDDTGYDVSKDYPYFHCESDMRGELK